ncbi:hypothetical protein [Streptomyces sp. I05A-00742]|uniref:hypothetical protein n=1 Tax=Streptomyces sp. I05A-00742 TaxID=2732853 RepID=UPI0014887AFF|nr:hypothetical protein [Streptomyces sp. I05A-00742]
MAGAFPQLDELSPSVYDVAAVSLAEGPQQPACVQWLTEHRTTPTSWGVPPEVNWYDCYLSTYAAALALYNAGRRSLAEPALSALAALVPPDPTGVLETLTFGGLVDALDRLCVQRGWPVPRHPGPVAAVVGRERAKWRRMRTWDRFLDPDRSIAGYCAERVYGDETIDAGAFLEAFQAPNGSVSNAPGASAFFFLEAQRRGKGVPPERIDRLRHYLHTCPVPVGYLDWVPHFTTAWSIMFEDAAGSAPAPDPAALDALCVDLAHPSGLLCTVSTLGGGLTVPGDSDSTACAMLAARIMGRKVPDSSRLDPLYAPSQGCYRTFLFEHDPSITTNIHMAAVLALDGRHDRLTRVLRWLNQAVGEGRTLCKWHLSPAYTHGELARVTAGIDHPLAAPLCIQAVGSLLATQNADGGWGLHNSTAEETGYAVHGLATAAHSHGPACTARTTDALGAAHTYLTIHRPRETALWLGKTLYCLRPLVPVLHRTALARIEQLALP